MVAAVSAVSPESVGVPKSSFASEFQRHSLTIAATRNIPIVTQAGLAVIYFSQTSAPSLIFQAIHPQSAGAGSVMNNPTLLHIAGRARILTAIEGIVALGTIIAEAVEIDDQIRKGRTTERNDAILRLVEGVAYLGDSVSSVARGLGMSEMVSQSAVSWAPFLGIASFGLSSVSIVINARGWSQANGLLDQLNTREDERTYTTTLTQQKEIIQEQLKTLREEIENKDGRHDGEYILQRHFEIIDRKKYAAKILRIIQNPHGEIPLGSQVHLVKALKARLSDKITSHKLAILSAVVGLVAALILFFPVLGPVMLGWGLAIAAVTLSFIKYYRDKNSVHRLEAEIDRICNS